MCAGRPLPLPCVLAHTCHLTPPCLQVSQHARCRVRVTISSVPGSVPAQGHKVSLFGLLVSHFPVRVAGAEGVEMFTEEHADINGRQ